MTAVAMDPAVGPLEVVLVAFALVHLIRWVGSLVSHSAAPTGAQVLELIVIAGAFYALNGVPIIADLTTRFARVIGNTGIGGVFIGLIFLGLAALGVHRYRKYAKVKRLGWTLLMGFSLLALGIAWPPFGQVLQIFANWTFGYGFGLLANLSQAFQTA